MTNDEIDKIQVAFCELFQALSKSENSVMSLPKQRVYLRALEDLGFEKIIQACRLAERSCKWFPSPAELRELVLGSPDQRAEIAWEAVSDAMSRYGAYRTVAFDDPIISRAIARCGGWISICDKSVTWLKKDFINSYKLLDNGQPIRPIRLPGIHEVRNERLAKVHGNSQPKIDGGRNTVVRIPTSSIT